MKSLLDTAHRKGRAKLRRLEAARRAIGALSNADRLVVFAEMACRIEAALNEPPVRRTWKGRPQYTDRAEDVLLQNPQGLRTCEIARLIGQSTPSAFVTLKCLMRSGRAVRHGTRNQRLWTPPGIQPVPRLESIGAAYLYVLGKASGPTDARTLKSEARKVAERILGRRPKDESMITGFARLHQAGLVASVGANEFGPMYVLKSRLSLN